MILINMLWCNSVIDGVARYGYGEWVTIRDDIEFSHIVRYTIHMAIGCDYYINTNSNAYTSSYLIA
jgi:hypothetical protein